MFTIIEKGYVMRLKVTIPVSKSVGRLRSLCRKTLPLNETGIVTAQRRTIF